MIQWWLGIYFGSKTEVINWEMNDASQRERRGRGRRAFRKNRLMQSQRTWCAGKIKRRVVRQESRSQNMAELRNPAGGDLSVNATRRCLKLLYKGIRFWKYHNIKKASEGRMAGGQVEFRNTWNIWKSNMTDHQMAECGTIKQQTRLEQLSGCGHHTLRWSR